MKVVVGLGNPGREYEHTRHNVGWWVVDHLADVWRFDGWRKDGESLTSSGLAAGAKVRLVKPLTYMNLSGSALRPYLRREGWSAATDLLIVSDEVALPVGTYRLRARGGTAGHNGLKSIQAAVGSQEYARLRIGVGPKPDEQRRVGDLANYVLGAAGKIEREEIRELFPRLTELVETWAREGVEVAMNRFNGS